MRKWLISLVLLPLIIPFKAQAEEFVISGNGNADSSVNVSEQQNTTVQQNNEAVVDSSTNTSPGADTTPQTGEDIIIKTGDLETDSTISNSDLNLNESPVCSVDCQHDTEAQSTEKETGSINDSDINSEPPVDIEQDIPIEQNVVSNVNIGNNSAGNSGELSVKTGEIEVDLEVEDTESDENIATAGFEKLLSLFEEEDKQDPVIDGLEEFFSDDGVEASNTENLNINENKERETLDSGNIFFPVSITNDEVDNSFPQLCCGPEQNKPEDGQKDKPEVPPSALPPGQVAGSGATVLSSSNQDSPGVQVAGFQSQQVLSGPLLIFLMILLSGLLFSGGRYLRLSTDSSPPLS